MKKLFLFLSTLIAALAFHVTAFASPVFYANPKYDLSTLDTIKLVEINDEIPAGGGEIASMPEEKLLAALYKGTQKHKYILEDVRSGDPNAAMSVKRGRAVKAASLQVTILDMTCTERVAPGYWTTRTYFEDYVWYDKQGYRHVDRVPVNYQEWVPPSLHKDMHIDLLYKLYDKETGDIIANCSDKRDRSDETNPTGMLGRSAEDFFKHLKKAAKK